MADIKDADRRLRRIIFTGAVLLLMFAIGIMQYWYIYITRTENLNDTYGVKINTFLPLPLQSWGCAQLKKRFSQFEPPTGCKSKSGILWQ